MAKKKYKKRTAKKECGELREEDIMGTGLWLIENNFIKDAIKVFKLAINQNHLCVSAYTFLGLCYGELGNNKKAFKYHLKATKTLNVHSLKEKIEKAFAFCCLARWLMLNNEDKKTRIEQAFEFLNKGIKLCPDYYALYYYRGLCYEIKGEKQKAIKDYEICLKLKPDFKLAKVQLNKIKKEEERKKKK